MGIAALLLFGREALICGSSKTKMAGDHQQRGCDAIVRMAIAARACGQARSSTKKAPASNTNRL